MCNSIVWIAYIGIHRTPSQPARTAEQLAKLKNHFWSPLPSFGEQAYLCLNALFFFVIQKVNVLKDELIIRQVIPVKVACHNEQ